MTAQVVFLKGINVGGHRRVRPSVLAKQLARFDVVNVGAAGTFVVGKPVSRTTLRQEIRRRLPFDAEVIICSASDIARLALSNSFARQPSGPQFIRFVGVLAKRRSPSPSVPRSIPPDGEWVVRVLGCRGQFVLGVHRRQMNAIGCLGQLEKIFGVPVAIRGWNTIVAIASILER